MPAEAPSEASVDAFDLARYSAAVFDLDGTVWLSDTPMPGAVEFVDRCRELGLTITFATNATAISVARIHELLIACGLGRPDDAVVTGGSVVAKSLATFGVTSVIAEAPPAMHDALIAEGIAVQAATGVDVPDGWQTPQQGKAVAVGASRSATFGSVELIGRLTSLGHPLYVTSPDPAFPARGRLEPGGGMLLVAMRALYPDIEPIVLGKPAKEYAEVVRATLPDTGRIVMFGDSQRADMGIAAHLGADGVLIAATGVVNGSLTAPHYVTTGLDAAIEPHREVVA